MTASASAASTSSLTASASLSLGATASCTASATLSKSAALTGIWFSTRDGGATDTELNRYGLLRWNGTRRGSWAAMEQVATKGDQLTNSCGDLEPPTIKIIAPTSATQFEDQIFISASGHDVDSGDLKRGTG